MIPVDPEWAEPTEGLTEGFSSPLNFIVFLDLHVSGI